MVPDRSHTPASWARLAAVNALVLLGLLGCIEAALWIAQPAGPGALTQKYQQNLRGLSSEISVAQNPLGIRSLTLLREEKAPGTLRILCLGASTTEQGNQSDDKMWSHLLGTQLQKVLGPSVKLEIGAYGSGGMGPFEDLKWAARNIPLLKPDIVVVLQGINVLSFRGGPTYHYDKEKMIQGAQRTDDAPAPVGKSAVSRWLAGHSHLYVRLVAFKRAMDLRRNLASGKAFTWSGSQLQKVIQSYGELPLTTIGRRDPDPIHELTDGMEALIALIQRHGAQAVVLGQPTLWKKNMPAAERATLWFPVDTPQGAVRVEPGWMDAEMERYNQAQAAVAARLGAIYIPLETLIPKTLDYFFDDCHFTDRGSQAVADSLFPYFEKIVSNIKR